MKIWIDADACPGEIKLIIFRAADRLSIPVVMVANKVMHVPKSKNISFIQVGMGADVADGYIADNSCVGEIAVTADIPLATILVEKGVVTINPRGELYTLENIRERLSMRDFMEGLRGAGLVTGGPAKFADKNKQNFAATLDKMLTQMLKK